MEESKGDFLGEAGERDEDDDANDVDEEDDEEKGPPRDALIKVLVLREVRGEHSPDEAVVKEVFSGRVADLFGKEKEDDMGFVF